MIFSIGQVGIWCGDEGKRKKGGGREEREGNGRRRKKGRLGGKEGKGKRKVKVKEKRIRREGEGKNEGIRNGEGGEAKLEIKLKNGRVGKEIKLLATLYNPGNLSWLLRQGSFRRREVRVQSFLWNSPQLDCLVLKILICIV